MIPGHRFSGIRAVVWTPRFPQQFAFPNGDIGILTDTPWEQELEDGGKAIMARAAVFKPIEGEEDASEQAEPSS